MGLGALTFLNPWLLAGLAALPAIWWLLRTVPPRPRQVDFPPTRILVDIENRDNTPAKTPWWLMLIRLLAAAAVIIALANPILNPNRGKPLKGAGPVVLVIDNGWASAAHWQQKEASIERLINEAERAGRPVMIVPTASFSKNQSAKLESPNDARSTAGAIEPLPFAPRRAAAIASIKSALRGQKEVSLVWVSDGIDHDLKASNFAADLIALASGGDITVIDNADNEHALGLRASVGQNGRLVATVVRAQGGARGGLLYAFSARGQRLSEAAFTLGRGKRTSEVTFDIPLELRNQVTRIAIAGERSAGSVALLDARSQWHRIGLISGGSQEEAQPLLAPLYYIKKAMRPYAELVLSRSSNVAEGIEKAFKQRSSILMLADIGTMSGELAEKVSDWVEKGGILVRFAGPRLEKGGDDLLPVPLRVGGRSLGGALSWTTPQQLAPFADNTPFAGLAVPKDVLIRRQVLADPTRIGRKVKVWARLKDGTPLVTAQRKGDGEIILFHVTANSDWSNLPLSGLFVEMLRRITTLGQLGGPARTDKNAIVLDGKSTGTKEKSAAAGNKVLAPIQVLNGFGLLQSPPPTAEAIEETKIFEITPSPAHPPGYYGSAGSPRALNVINKKIQLKPLPALPAAINHRIMETTKITSLKPWLLAAALLLLFSDVIAVLLLQAGGNLRRRRRAVNPATGAAVILAVLALGSGLIIATTPPASAQVRSPTTAPPAAISDKTIDGLSAEFVIRATGKVTFGYVLTGDERADKVSRQGLIGLTTSLQRRTAVEPGDPAAVNILKDEIALYPILYWPVLPNAKELPDKILAKIDAYMKQGGMIIFDTRDFGQGLPTGFAMSRRGASPLQRLLGKLDIPRLEPVPQGHVLTKSFYLLRNFPGRWSGGDLWVEADAGGSTDGRRQARRADGVSSILVTSNDFASAWAVDLRGRPLYPTVPGGNRQREMAVRTGINIVMYALTGNYKADQVHIPALLERLGQ